MKRLAQNRNAASPSSIPSSTTPDQLRFCFLSSVISAFFHQEFPIMRLTCFCFSEIRLMHPSMTRLSIICSVFATYTMCLLLQILRRQKHLYLLLTRARLIGENLLIPSRRTIENNSKRHVLCLSIHRERAAGESPLCRI